MARTATDVDAGAGESRFRILVEHVKDYGIFILSPAGHVETWNAGAERLKGYTAAEIIGQHFSVFYPPADVTAGKCEMELEGASRDGRFEDEGWRIRKDGTRFWANVVITALRDDAGALIGFAKVTRDLTERRFAEEEARRFRLLVESVKDYGIFILSPEGRIETWNAGAERLKGYAAAEIIGQHFSVFYPPADVAAGKCEMELEGASRDGRFEDEGWRVRQDGTLFWANVVITALRNEAGVLIGFAKVTRDLTERRAAEEEARRFRLLVESVKDYGIFILSPEGRIETWNAGAERLKGYTAAEIIGQHFSVFYPPAEVAGGKCEIELEGASRDGRFEDEGWRIRKDGTRFWANVVITALRNDAGALIGFAKVTRDLTERRQAEETERSLAAERAMLAEKSRIQQFQERFLAILGHDLRNPLAAIDMGASLLRAHGAQDAASLRILDRVDASASRMSRMIEQILDLTRSRLAAGLEIQPRPTDLGAVLTAIVDELQTAHPARAVDLKCLSISGNWDRDRLEQLFSNLLGNAIHYGAPEHPITVRARSEGNSVVVDVHNYGVPIPDELQAKLFDPFRRGTRESRTSTTQGLGLGLYISREIAVAHGGDIEVVSNESQGTTFRVRLPLSTQSSTAAVS